MDAMLADAVRRAKIANPFLSFATLASYIDQLDRGLEGIVREVDARQTGAEALAREIEAARRTLLHVAVMIRVSAEVPA